MNVLIMGEESQEICLAFLEKGHNAYSCDYQDCSGGRPDRHIKGDMFEAFNNTFYPDLPDLIIVHPTCTYMCNSGVLRLYKDGKKVNGKDPIRWGKMTGSAIQFKRILNLPCAKIAVENPIMHGHAASIIGVKHTQTIQPYEYGHPESKRTCLWLRGLPKLQSTNILPLPECGHWKNQTASGQNKLPPSATRGKQRSKTYRGIAEAMAAQWG
jgi:hypothetical protein